MGVPAGAVTFLALPDGNLHRHAAAARRGLSRAVGHAPPSLIALPFQGDDHPDHRTVAACIAALRRPGLRRLAYPVWPAGRRPAGARTLFLTAQERLAKRRAVQGYRTQTGWITDDPHGFAMTQQQIAAFTRPRELFVEQRR